MVVNNQAACDDNYVNRPHDLSILGNSANFVITDHQSSSMITKALVDARITWTCGLQTVMIYPDWDKKILCLVNHDYQGRLRIVLTKSRNLLNLSIRHNNNQLLTACATTTASKCTPSPQSVLW